LPYRLEGFFCDFIASETVLAFGLESKGTAMAKWEWGTRLFCGLLLFPACLWPAGGHAEDADGTGKEKIETEHIFGFTEGTDIGEKGEQEFESTIVARLGKPGSYAAIVNESAYRNVIFDGFRLSFSALPEYYSIHSFPGLADRNQLDLSGLSSELRWQLLDRTNAPIGLSISLTPEWRRVDDPSGAYAETLSLPAGVALDAALVPDKLFMASNLIYDASITRSGSGWEHSSSLEVSTAASYAILPEVFIGAELRYIAWEEQSFLSTRGLFAGPSIYLKLSNTAALKVAWSAEIAEENARGPGLSNFERNQAIVLFVKSF